MALVESVLCPGGWENVCRLMCHCVRHIGLDNKHGQSVESIQAFAISLEGWHGALCRQTGRAERQEGLDGEREASEELEV